MDLQGLERLDLNISMLSDEKLRILKALPRLRTLFLRGVQLTDNDQFHLEQLAERLSVGLEIYDCTNDDLAPGATDSSR